MPGDFKSKNTILVNGEYVILGPDQDELRGRNVAILVTDGFQQVEMTETKKALNDVGVEASIVSPNTGKVKAWKHTQWGDEFHVDVPLDCANADEFDALVLPGGLMNPDKLRRNELALQFVRAFFESRKPVAAICHGPLPLIDADVVWGRKMTSCPSIQADLKNAGARWVDEEVVVDNGLITSRSPDDMPAFNRRVIEEIGEGVLART